MSKKTTYFLFGFTSLLAIICIIISKVDPSYWNLSTIEDSIFNNRALYSHYLIPISISFLLTLLCVPYGTYTLIKQIKILYFEDDFYNQHFYKQQETYSIKELIVLGITTILLACYLLYIAWYLFLLVFFIALVFCGFKLFMEN